MARPTRRIKCRQCKRTISTIILKSYTMIDKKDMDYDNHFQKLLIKDHRRSILSSRHCSASGKIITVQTGSSTPQAR